MQTMATCIADHNKVCVALEGTDKIRSNMTIHTTKYLEKTVYYGTINSSAQSAVATICQ